MSVLKFILDFLFPKLCLNCKKLIKKTEHCLCENCITKINNLPICNSSNISSPYKYNSIIKNILHAFKYKKQIHVITILFNILKSNNYFSNFQKLDYILPVPLHNKRKKKRTFNQSEIIASKLSAILHIPILDNLLLRTKNTLPLFKLNKSERIKELKNAFTLKENEVLKGKSILLIDDIITTGTTLNECKKLLKLSGAGRINVFTIAYKE